jgi:hypothetical protein
MHDAMHSQLGLMDRVGSMRGPLGLIRLVILLRSQVNLFYKETCINQGKEEEYHLLAAVPFYPCPLVVWLSMCRVGSIRRPLGLVNCP